MNTEQERAEFEAWYRLHHGSRNVYGRDASGEYADKQVQGAFNVWQARAALAAQPAAATAGEAMNEEPVAWRWRWKDLPDAGWQLSSVGGWRDTEHIEAQPLYTHPTPPAQTSGQAAPSDEEIIADMEARGWKYMDEEERTDIIQSFRVLFARYGQAPAASAEPFAVLTVHKSGQIGMFADAQSVRLRPITDEDRRFYREQRGCELVEVFRAPVAAQAPVADGGAA